ncbi:MAG: hypothetical protein HFH41_04160 [Lachnospiraceae bacterium]|nr:hypothetical protein [Lachnospiraceae bacterium]
MAAEKKSVAKEIDKQSSEYRVVGGKFKNKAEANTALKEIFKKGFKNAGLMVLGNEFVVLFGTYNTAYAAEMNAEAVKKAGFKSEILEI